MTVYTLYPPTVPSGLLKFSFITTIAGNKWTFTFEWRTACWAVEALLPSGSIREARVVPNVVNWSRNPDYNIWFTLGSAIEIGFADIGNIAVHVLVF